MKLLVAWALLVLGQSIPNGTVTTNMSWSVGFSPTQGSNMSAYGWDDANLTVYAYNDTGFLISYNLLSRSLKLYAPGSSTPWPPNRPNSPYGPSAPLVWAARWQRLFLFGGGAGTPLGDTWALDPVLGQWARGPTGLPVRKYHAAAADATGTVWTFGGSNGATIMADLWQLTVSSVGPLTVSGTWTQVATSQQWPGVRWGSSSMTHSAGSLFLFGGYDGINYRADLWQFRISARAWTNLQLPSTAPAARSAVGMTPYLGLYDAAGQVLVGPGSNTGPSDLWLISNGAPTQLLTTSTAFMTGAAALFVSQQQARVYMFFATSVAYVQLNASVTCATAVACPSGLIQNPSPSGTGLDHATCCLATTTSSTTSTSSGTTSSSSTSSATSSSSTSSSSTSSSSSTTSTGWSSTTTTMTSTITTASSSTTTTTAMSAPETASGTSSAATDTTATTMSTAGTRGSETFSSTSVLSVSSSLSRTTGSTSATSTTTSSQAFAGSFSGLTALLISTNGSDLVAARQAMTIVLDSLAQLESAGNISRSDALQAARLVDLIASNDLLLGATTNAKVTQSLALALQFALKSFTTLTAQEATIFATAAMSLLTKSSPSLVGNRTATTNVSRALGAILETTAQALVRGLFQSAQDPVAITVHAGGLEIRAVALQVQTPTTLEDQPIIQVAGLPALVGLPSGVAFATEAAISKNGSLATLGLTFVRLTVNVFGPSPSEGDSAASQLCGKAAGGAIMAALCSGNALGPVQSLSLNTAAGALEVRDLLLPIVFAVPLDKLSYEDVETALLGGVHPQCKYWDAKTFVWRTDGCRTLGINADGNGLLCACTHLTSFGSFSSADVSLSWIIELIDLLAGRLQCSYAVELLSPEGFAVMKTQSWTGRTGACVIFSVVSFQLLIYFFAVGQDWKAARAAIDIPQDQLFAQSSGRICSSGFGSVCSRASATDMFTILVGPALRFLTRNAAWREAAIGRTADCIAASRLGVDRATFRTLLAYEEALQDGSLAHHLRIDGVPVARIEAFHESHRERISGREGVVPPTYVMESGHYSQSFLSGTDKKVAALLWALHPFSQSTSQSLHHRYSARVLVQLMTINAGLASGCLFFRKQGAISWDSTDDCKSTRPMGQIVGQLFVMALTTLAAEGPSQALMLVDNNSSYRNSTWGLLGKELLKAVVLNLLSLGLNVLYSFILCSFLANIAEPDVQLWLLTNLTTLFATVLILKPLLWTIAAVLLSVLHRALQRVFSSDPVTTLQGTSDVVVGFDAVLPTALSTNPAANPTQASGAPMGSALPPQPQEAAGAGGPRTSSAPQEQRPAAVGTSVAQTAPATTVHQSTGGGCALSVDGLLQELQGSSADGATLPGHVPSAAAEISIGVEIDNLLQDLEQGQNAPK